MSKKTYIKVYWDDTLENYTRAKERDIQRYFEKKYDATVNVVFRAIRNIASTEMELPQADATDQVLDVNYQRQLMQQYMKANNITVPWNFIIKMDDAVNSKLAESTELNIRYKKFFIRKIILNNFLSYADQEQVIPLDTLHGMTLIQSEPVNKAGKTIGIIDSLLFLFFGKTTRTDTLEEVFNLYTKSDVVYVKGEVEIDDEVYLIERRVTRKLKRDKVSYNIENDVTFKRVLPNGVLQNLEGEENRKTTKKITEYIGNYEDFLLTIITTIRNFYSLIESKPTERGKIFTRFIGVETLADKAEIAKKMQAEWFRTSKLSQTNSEQLDKLISIETEKINGFRLLADNLSGELTRLELERANKEKDIEIERLKKRQSVDEDLYKVREDDLLLEIDRIGKLIAQKESSIKVQKDSAKEPQGVFDVDTYNHTKGELQTANNDFSDARAKKGIAESAITQLKNGEICPFCKRPLEGVDHTAEITAQTKLVAELTEKMNTLGATIGKLSGELQQMDGIKEEWATYDKSMLIIERNELELATFRNNLNAANDKLGKYRQNKAAIEENRVLDTKISSLQMQLRTITNEREGKLLEHKGYLKDIDTSTAAINKYTDAKKEVAKDEAIQKIYTTYIEIFGKNGISKMILATMIPIINTYLHQMMFDAVPFRLEVRLNEKNEVEFWMIDEDEGGVQKRLKAGSGYESTISLLALRCVLSKVCSLPKPNMVVFDEVFGQVGNENMPLLGAFFERMKEYFDNIFIITHNPVMLEWADHVIYAKKVDNLTYISTNDIKKE